MGNPFGISSCIVGSFAIALSTRLASDKTSAMEVSYLDIGIFGVHLVKE